MVHMHACMCVCVHVVDIKYVLDTTERMYVMLNYISMLAARPLDADEWPQTHPIALSQTTTSLPPPRVWRGKEQEG